MKKSFILALSLCMALGFLGGTGSANEAFKAPLGVLQNNPGATDGYVLLAPQNSKTTYLIDNNGKIVNQWVSEYVAFCAEMLPNGNMIRHSRLPEAQPAFGGVSGLMEEFDWSGKKIWEYKMFEPEKIVSHHTFEVMPNGNYLILGWEYKSFDEAVAKGMKTDIGRAIFPDGIRHPSGHQIMGVWPDMLREVDHDGKTVWEWHVWDYVGTGKDQFDINKFIPPNMSRILGGPDWTHFNGVAYNPRTDQICMTSRNLGEVYVIDKKTGKMIYRWGNPANYGAGKAPAGYADDGDQKLFGPHAPDWTADDTITILDNGTHRPSGTFTRAVEIDPKADKLIWEWRPQDVAAFPANFYSAFQCGAQKQPNGNWMITSTNVGHVIEVTPTKEIVWELANPVAADVIYKSTSAHGAAGDSIHKAMRYAKDYPGFAGKEFKDLGQFPNWISVLAPDPRPMKPMPK